MICEGSSYRIFIENLVILEDGKAASVWTSYTRNVILWKAPAIILARSRCRVEPSSGRFIQN